MLAPEKKSIVSGFNLAVGAEIRTQADQGLIDFFLLGIWPFRSEIFVVIGKLVHCASQKTDKSWAHRIEPLRGSEKQGCGAHYPGQGQDAHERVQPTGDRSRVNVTRGREDHHVAPSERSEDTGETDNSPEPGFLAKPIKSLRRDRITFGGNPAQSPSSAQVQIIPPAQNRADYRCYRNRGKKRQSAQRFQKSQEEPSYQAEDDQNVDHSNIVISFRPESKRRYVSRQKKRRRS